jgi:5-methylthioadenosine/S-adenosylhomocysteine deaminase
MDLFREMDTLSKLQKVAREDASALTAKDALKMATIWGARALGMGDRIGSLEVGKEADIIIIDTDKPHLYPCYDPYSTLVYSAKGSDVRDVIIGGEVIMEKRRILRLDVHGIMHEIKKITQMITAERLNSMLNHRGV